MKQGAWTSETEDRVDRTLTFSALPDLGLWRDFFLGDYFIF